MFLFPCLSLSLPSTFLLYHYTLVFVVFLSLTPRTKFSLLPCFIASFRHLPSILFFLFISSSCHLPSFIFLSPHLLVLPSFVPCFLFVPFFLPVFIPYCLLSLSKFTFSPSLLYCSPPTIQRFFLSSPFLFLSFHIFSCNLSPFMIRKTPKLIPCTSYDVTSANLLSKPSGVKWRRKNRRCNLPKK
jgi:hypothetical protein